MNYWIVSILALQQQQKKNHFNDNYPIRPNNIGNDEQQKSKCFAQVYIRPSTQPFQRIQHRVAVSYEELIGTIGGDMGILLGMSIFSFISLTVSCLQRCLVKMVYGSPTMIMMNNG